MKILFQPEKSSTCGQHCVAMISGVSPEESISVFRSVGATNTKQLHKVLNHFGFESPEKLEKIKSSTVLPDLCILKITYDWRKNTGHWVVYKNGFVYCPSLGVYSYSDHEYVELGRPTSFLKITKKNV